MKLNKDIKGMVHSHDGNTNFFDIVARVLQGDILAPYLFLLCLDYVLRTSINLLKENGFTLRKSKKTTSYRNYDMQTTQMTKHFS